MLIDSVIYSILLSTLRHISSLHAGLYSLYIIVFSIYFMLRLISDLLKVTIAHAPTVEAMISTYKFKATHGESLPRSCSPRKSQVETARRQSIC